MSLLRYLKKGSGSVLPSPGGSLSRHMPSSSIASANKEVKSVLECRSHKPRSQTSSLLSVDSKRGEQIECGCGLNNCHPRN